MGGRLRYPISTTGCNGSPGGSTDPMAEGFGAAESAAVALVRGLNAPTMSIGQLVANAQRAIGMYQQRHILSRASELQDEQQAVPLIVRMRCTGTLQARTL
jgi:hypothetical protein